MTSATTLSYDAASRLSKTILNGAETQLLYDGTNLVAEHNSTGTLLKRYVHSNGIDEPIVVYSDATTTNKNWFYADHLGSIVALANTTGTATATYTYSAEGKQAGSTGVRFGYTGQQNLAGLGVQYYKARMYSADLGRFIQTDPIGTQDDMNLYAYVGNSAVNGRDPSGRYGVYGGVTGGAAAVKGASISSGAYYSPDVANGLPRGRYDSTATEWGLGAGVAAQLGFFVGNGTDLLNGKAQAFTGTFGPVSLTVTFSSGQVSGGAIAVGYGLPLGATAATSNTTLSLPRK